MSASREAILGALRRRLDRRDGDDPAVDRPADAPVPERTRRRGGALASLFVSEAERVDATVDRVADWADVPGAVARYLADRNLPARLVVANDAALGPIDWTSRPSLEVSVGAPSPDDPVAVTGAVAGVAETGSVVVASGPDTPAGANFLPEVQVVVLEAARLVGGFESLWPRWRADGRAALPRVVGWITGPSRSGDIEQTLLLGAHGPKRLHIVLVGRPDGGGGS